MHTIVRINRRPQVLSGQLGQRIVTISGSGTDNTLFGESQVWFKTQITGAMNNNRIGTSGIRVTVGGGSVSFEIEVLNSTNASPEAIRQLVQVSLDNLWYTYTAPIMTGVPQGRRVFSNVTTRVASDSGDAPPPPAVQPGNLPGQQPPANNTGNNNSGGGGGGGFDLSSLGLGALAGVSSTVLIGGALFFLFLLKR
jgi:hypothetical protein